MSILFFFKKKNLKCVKHKNQSTFSNFDFFFFQNAYRSTFAVLTRPVQEQHKVYILIFKIQKIAISIQLFHIRILLIKQT
jgi:hypothetical protein